jgi:hypothetical protein
VRLRFSFAVAFTGLSLAALFALDCADAGPCSRNSECQVGYYCDQAKGRCVRNCVDAARDCDPGYVCDINGQCKPPDGGVPVDGGGQPDAPSTNDVTQPPADTGPGDVVVVDAPQTFKKTLDLCASDGECQSGLVCRSLYKGGPARCTPTCSSSSQCMTGTRCLTIGADTYCAEADEGLACSTNNPSTCNYACVSPGYCTTPCTTGADCPNGYGCATVSNQKVCVRAEQYCGSGPACTSLLCDSSLPASSCTLGCTSAADCPQRSSALAPWTCSSGTCKRPADVYGPLAQGDVASYACNGSNQIVNLCNDAQHIDFDQFVIPSPPSFACPVSNSVDGPPNDTCVDTCRFAGGCAFGYACTSVGNLGQRVGLCLPDHGAGEVGASCTKDRDCAFGYCSQSKCSRDCSADGVCPTGSSCTPVGGSYPNVEGIPFKRCQ